MKDNDIDSDPFPKSTIFCLRYFCHVQRPTECPIFYSTSEQYLGDSDREESFLPVVDRADTGTSIKNGAGGQRLIALDERICTLLTDYIRDRRREITDGSRY